MIGIDFDAACIADAENNAKLNGITNATYIHAKVEDALEGVLNTHVAGGTGLPKAANATSSEAEGE